MKLIRRLLCRFSYSRNRFGLVLTMVPTDAAELKKRAQKKRETFWNEVAPGIIGVYFLTAIALGFYQLAVFVLGGLISLPFMSPTFFFTALGLLGSSFLALVASPDVSNWLRSIHLPEFLESKLADARNAAQSIARNAKSPLIKADPEALTLAKEAGKLYDNLLLDLETIMNADPNGFRRSFMSIESERKDKSMNDQEDEDSYTAWLKETLTAIPTLIEINSNLKEIVASRLEEQTLQARAKALQDTQKKRVASSRPKIEESLGSIKLREDIRKKSSLELAQFVSSLEDKEALKS